MEKKPDRNFCNRSCEHFPCHKDADAENFSCVFCYCPLYAMEDCGGSYTCTKDGKKDCSACTIPHESEKHDDIIRKSEAAFKAVRRERRRKISHRIACVIISVLLGLAAGLLPIVLLKNAWRITEMLDLPEVTQVIAQLKDASFTPAYIPVAICAATSCLLMLRLRRNKIIAAVLVAVVFVVSFAAAFAFTESSGVPVHTIVQILIEFVQSGAF